jgi:hypothetical protein
MMMTGVEAEYVLFEFIDGLAVTFRRSDMDYPDIRRQFLWLLKYFLAVDMNTRDWEYTLARIPEEWGDYIGFKLVRKTGPGRAQGEVFKAEREPGVDSGENPVITSVDRTSEH